MVYAICDSGFDYNIDAYVLVYIKRKKSLLDPETDRLKELHFGDFDESFGSIWKEIKPIANTRCTPEQD